MTNSVISYPAPAYQNLPIQPYFYQPSRFEISAIGFGSSVTTVTTTVDNNYVVGQQIRFNIPTDCGSRQLNDVTGYVVEILSATQFAVSVPSSGFTPFKNPIGRDEPQVVAIGDVNSGVVNNSGSSPVGLYIPGSFRDIS